MYLASRKCTYIYIHSHLTLWLMFWFNIPMKINVKYQHIYFCVQGPTTFTLKYTFTNSKRKEEVQVGILFYLGIKQLHTNICV